MQGGLGLQEAQEKEITMATIKQKRLAKAIVENLESDKPKNKKEMLVSVGYKESTAETKPSDIIESEGVQEALADLGFSEDNAKKVVSDIMLNDEVDPNARLKATDQVFKVHGSYVADKNGGNKTLVVMISGESAKRYNIETNG